MPKKPSTPNNGKSTSAFLTQGGEPSSPMSTIHLFVVGDEDEASTKALKMLKVNGSTTSSPITSTSPGPQKDPRYHYVTVPDVYNFEEVAKLLPAQIDGSTHTRDNTAIIYFVNINRGPPQPIDSSFTKAIGKKCRPSRFFWVTVGWDDDNAVKQKALEFELRNVVMSPTIQQGSHFMRLPMIQGALTREVMLLVEQSFVNQETPLKGVGLKNANKKTLNMFHHAFSQLVESKLVQIEDLTVRDIIIAVIGPVGVGKSTFIKTISGHDGVLIGHGLESCTSEFSIIRFRAPELSDHNIALVDTPGFDDTNQSDVEILQLIAKWLDKTFKRKIYLDGILYLHRISDNRMMGSPYNNYPIFEQLCGKSCFKQIALVTTMWGDPSEEEAFKEREDELRLVWGKMINNGSMIARFDDNRSPFDIIGPIASNATASRHALTLQNELNGIKLSLPVTSAGRVMYTILEALLERQKKILDDMRKDIAPEAEESGNQDGAGQMQNMLEEEFRVVEQAMKTVATDLQAMKLSVPSRLLMSLSSRFQLRFSFSKAG